MLQEVASLMRSGQLRLPVEEPPFPLGAVAAALARAQSGRRAGKVVLDLRQDEG